MADLARCWIGRALQRLLKEWCCVSGLNPPSDMLEAVIFQDLFYVWLVGLLGGLVAYFLRQPLLLGYMLGGLFVSPFTPGPVVQHVETIQRLADFGVILLMFSIGLEMAPIGLRRIGKASLFLGLLNTILLASVWVPIGRWLGWTLTQSVVLGFALSVSSTMVITKMLQERQELQTDYGHMLLGIAIVEDFVMMALLAFLPIMANPSGWQAGSMFMVIGKTMGFLILMYLLGVRLVPWLLNFIGKTHDAELSLLVLLVIALGTGVVGVLCGLSLALGAFIAGLVVSGSETTTVTVGRMLPMRDLFVVTFFVSLGVLLDPRLVLQHGGLLSMLLVFVLLIKFIVSAALCLMFSHSWHVAWRVGVGLSQIGEFSVVLSTIARSLGLLPADLHHLIVAASLLSILVNTFSFNLLEKVPSVARNRNLGKATLR